VIQRKCDGHGPTHHFQPCRRLQSDEGLRNVFGPGRGARTNQGIIAFQPPRRRPQSSFVPATPALSPSPACMYLGMCWGRGITLSKGLAARQLVQPVNQSKDQCHSGGRESIFQARCGIFRGRRAWYIRIGAFSLAPVIWAAVRNWSKQDRRTRCRETYMAHRPAFSVSKPEASRNF